MYSLIWPMAGQDMVLSSLSFKGYTISRESAKYKQGIACTIANEWLKKKTACILSFILNRVINMRVKLWKCENSYRRNFGSCEKKA